MIKINRIICALVCSLAGHSAFAANACTTVESPAISTTPFSASPAPTTCNKNTNLGVTGNIGGASGFGGWQQGTAAGIGIYEVDLGAGNNGFTVTVSNAQFKPTILLGGADATCEDIAADQYDAASTVGDPNGATFTTSGALPAGKYWLFIGDTTGGTGDAGCGTYDLAVTGTLPVKAQSFSVD